MNGYRKMISDRIPPVWDMTIRWCKCRNRFVEYVYNNVVRPTRTDVMHTRKEKAKLVPQRIKDELNPKLTSFREAVRLMGLLNYNKTEDYNYWKVVADWNDFFATRALYIKNSCVHLRSKGATTKELIAEISERYGIDSKLAEFIIKTFKV